MLNIAYEDNHLIVVIKPQNLPTQEDDSKDKDLLNLLKEHIKTKENKPGNVYLGLVHRLDRPTGGLMVFAKSSKAAARLTQAFKDREIEKHYLACVVGAPKDKTGTLVNYLKKDMKNNIVKIAPQTETGAKFAQLDYKVLEQHPKLTLLNVTPQTGRSHQIRVQLSNIKLPIYADAKYGGGSPLGVNMALWAYKLKFTHPTTKKLMSFVSFPPVEEIPWKSFNIEKYLSI